MSKSIIPEVSTQQWLEQNADKYEDREQLIAACVKALGVTERTVQRYVVPFMRGRTPCAKGGGDTIPLKAVVAELDIHDKIRHELSTLGNSVLRESDLRLRLGESQERFRKAVRSEKWSANRIEIKRGKYKGWLWGRAPVIEEIKNTMDVR
jgi:hypothetical protein